MKILHVIAQLPAKTGSGVYFSNMIEEFKKYGHEQKAIFAVQDDYFWASLDRGDQYPVNFKSPGLDFPVAGMSDVMPYDNTVYSEMTDEMIGQWQRAFRQVLEKVKSEFTPDLIFAHHLWMLTSMVTEVFPDVKIIGICHNTDLRQARMNPNLQANYVTNMDKLDHIFCASEEQKDEIIETYQVDRNRLIAVGGGYNQNIFYPPAQKTFADKVRLVFCAKVDPSKGIYELVEVYQELNLPDVTLDIIGIPNEENRAKIEKYIGDNPSIRLYNVRNQAALGDELRTKDIYLMPSYYEGLGLMAIESLACGLYVVTTEIEALMSLLGPEVKDSGVIKYVELPGIYDVDKPVQADLPAFKERLKAALLEQIDKVRAKETFPDQIRKEISCLSWEGLVEEMNHLITNPESDQQGQIDKINANCKI